jgi:hypothetical protein
LVALKDTTLPRKPPEQRSPYERRLKSSAVKARDSGDDDPAADVLLRAAAVRKRYGGASDMWLFRRLHDDSKFPAPLYIGPIRYWRLRDLIAWEHTRGALPIPEPRILQEHEKAIAALAVRRKAKTKTAETARVDAA